MAIGTPLGADALILKSVSANEQLGRLFRYEVDVLSAKSDVDFEKILGQNVTIRMQRPDGEIRFLNGYVSRFEVTGYPAKLTEYRATIVPHLWVLTRHTDCRIFQNLSVTEIFDKVVKEQHGYTDIEIKLENASAYKKRENCVQYRETDFEFISRLLEEEGIYYFFKHEDGKHTMVLCNSPVGHEATKEYETLPFRQTRSHLGTERVMEFTIESEIKPVQYTHTDYDFKETNKDLKKTAKSTPRQHGFNKGEIFDYPGRYIAPDVGEGLGKVRIEEIHAGYMVAHGRTDAIGLYTGAKVKLTEHPREAINAIEWLVTSTTWRAVNNVSQSVSGVDDQRASFACTFTALDATVPFRTPRTTQRPVVHGPQTAVVVGKKGEEIWTDEHGRVKVQFFWDRESKGDENSSCWCRVSQGWAGKNWGMITIPRMGQEVIVDFLEGDPDQPIITGRVYNGTNKPPYALPANATMSTVKSNSSKGGAGFNEIRFEDKKDSEQIFVHAQKDYEQRVLNDRKELIKHDRHLIVENDKFEHVKHDRSETIDNDHKEKIGNDRNLKVVGKEAKAVDKTLSLTVGEDVVEVFKKNHSETVTEDYFLKAKNICIEATENITIKVGPSHIAIEKSGIKIGADDGQIVIEAMKTLEVKSKGPQGGITIEASVKDVGIKGTSGMKLETPATLDAKGSMVNVKGDAMAEMASPMTTVKGDGMLTLKGGMTMIN
jgi:type VI secretion system secreted protein VgrG